jgi:hypothetical protein
LRKSEVAGPERTFGLARRHYSQRAGPVNTFVQYSNEIAEDRRTPLRLPLAIGLCLFGKVLAMAKIKVTLPGFRCDRCGHEWAPRKANAQPVVCPSCKSPYWDKPKKPVRKK